MATNVSTIGSGQDYATVLLWQDDTDNDLVAAGDIEVGELVDDTTITSLLQFAGATTDASNYRHLRPNAGNEYDPVAGTGRSLTATSAASNCIAMETEGFVRIRGLLIVSDSEFECVYFTAGSDGSSMERCFVRSTDYNAVSIEGAALNIDVFNCILDGTAAGVGMSGLKVANGATADIYNVVSHGWSRYCFELLTVAVNMRNCAGTDNSGAFADFLVTAGSGTKSHNLSSDATAPGTSSQQSKTSSSVFTDAANEDFTLLKSGAAHNNGVDLSGEFTEGILGLTRGSEGWDIGAYVSANDTVSGFQFPVRGIY